MERLTKTNELTELTAEDLDTVAGGCNSYKHDCYKPKHHHKHHDHKHGGCWTPPYCPPKTPYYPC